jgi:hypothetical protein
MTVKMSVTVRNAILDAFETAIGASAVLKLRTGAPPTNIADADSGTVVFTLSLPANWMADAAAGSKALSGTWEDTVADNPGTIGHFRIYASDGTTQHMQGTVTVTGGGGDMTLDNNVVLAGQSFSQTAFTLTAPHA